MMDMLFITSAIKQKINNFNWSSIFGRRFLYDILINVNYHLYEKCGII